ncbi:MAG TPA: ABC transporter permease [Candidatus Angelobacter sp.]|nr:ABC transporter permease [Candidatus Angelobacter sp.]
MTAWNRFRSWVLAILGRARMESEMDAELRFHMEAHAEDLMRSGMPREEAARQARIEFGGVERAKEECREARGVSFTEALAQDVRYGLRTLRKSPGFTTVIVLTLALGIGANTAIFSVVNAVLLRPLAYRDSTSLVNLWAKMEKDGIPQLPFSEPEYWDLIDRNESFSAIAAYSLGSGANLTRTDAPPIQVSEGQATASLFPMLGVTPLLGRSFSVDEDQPGHLRFVLLSYALWQSQFGGEPNIASKQIQLDGETYIILGVLPKQFSLGGKQDLWVPLALDRAKPNDRGSHYMRVIARLKPGVNTAQVTSGLVRFANDLQHTYPDNYGEQGVKNYGVFSVPVKEQLVGQLRPALLVLLGAVAFVLLIACANVANLLLTQASLRERELAIRGALGAGRARLVRQLLTESLILALAGGVLGLGLAYWGVSALRALVPANTPRIDEVQMDPLVLAFTFVVSLLTGLIFGLAPAWQFSRSDLREGLNESGRGSSPARGSRRLRAALAVSELGLATLLLAGAGLLIRSFSRLVDVSPGFQAQHLLTLELSLPEKAYTEGVKVQNFFSQLMARVESIPGIQSAGAISQMPFTDSYYSGSVFVKDTPVTDLLRYKPVGNFPYLEIDQRVATPGYFQAMNIPLVRGRLPSKADDAAAPLIAVVDENFARRFWPQGEAIGQQVAVDLIPNVKPLTPRWRTVVGVVGHVKHYGLDVEGREQIYTPHAQPLYGSTAPRDMTLAVRTSLPPSSVTNAIREQVLAMDKDLPLYHVATMKELVSDSVAQPRLNLWLLSAFAGLALALAAVGVYGVMAYTVAQRTPEIGIRLALGATPADVLKQVLAEGSRLILGGLVLGIVTALALTRLMASLLFVIKADDPLTIGVAGTLLAVIALLACYVPARRATRVDPLVALRYE